MRRRFTSTVGLGVYNIQGNYRPGEADWRLVVRIRVDADFGINQNLPSSQAGGESTYLAGGQYPGVRYIPGLQIAPVDIMYGYLEGRNLAHGLLGVRIGRQYQSDVLGWWAFDGALVKLTTPAYFNVEAYGGLEERGGLPASTARFESQGVWRGSHQGFDQNNPGSPASTDYPSYLYAQPAPAFGVAVESAGPSWIHGRFSYRHVYNTGTALTTQFPSAADSGGYRQITGIRTSQERLGWAADVTKSDLGQVKGGFTYDLYNQWVDAWYAGAEAYLGKRVTLGADADYFVPTFDGDSIFNWFTHGPITTLTARVAVKATKRLNITASGGARLWWAQGDPTATAGGLSVWGQNSASTWRTRRRPSSSPAARGSAGARSIRAPTRRSPTPSATPTGPPPPPSTASPTSTGATASPPGGGASGAWSRPGPAGSARAPTSRARSAGTVAATSPAPGSRLYGWSDPTRPDRDAVSFGYVLAAGIQPSRRPTCASSGSTTPTGSSGNATG